MDDPSPYTIQTLGEISSTCSVGGLARDFGKSFDVGGFEALPIGLLQGVI